MGVMGGRETTANDPSVLTFLGYNSAVRHSIGSPVGNILPKSFGFSFVRFSMIFNGCATEKNLIFEGFGTNTIFLGKTVFPKNPSSFPNTNLMRESNDLGIFVSRYLCPKKIFKYKGLSAPFNFRFCNALYVQRVQVHYFYRYSGNAFGLAHFMCGSFFTRKAISSLFKGFRHPFFQHSFSSCRLILLLFYIGHTEGGGHTLGGFLLPGTFIGDICPMTIIGITRGINDPVCRYGKKAHSLIEEYAG